MPIFGCDNMQDAHELKTSEGALAGAWLVCQGVGDDFRAAYEKQFGNTDVISGGAVFYEMTRLLQQAARTGADRASLIKRLIASGRHDGALGEFEIASAGGDQFFKTRFVIMQFDQTGLRRQDP